MLLYLPYYCRSVRRCGVGTGVRRERKPAKSDRGQMQGEIFALLHIDCIEDTVFAELPLCCGCSVSAFVWEQIN